MIITFGNATVQRLYFERQLAERLNHLRFYKITECLLRMHHGYSFPDIADWLHSRGRNTARATLGEGLAVSAFPRYVPV